MSRSRDESNRETDELASIKLNDEGKAYDDETGEVFDNPDSIGFLKLFDDNLWKLELIGNAKVRLLCFLIRSMNRRTNICNCTQRDICDALDLSQNYMSQMLNEMERVGLILMGRGYYQVSPDFVWLGNEPARRKAWAVYKKKKDIKLNKQR